MLEFTTIKIGVTEINTTKMPMRQDKLRVWHQALTWMGGQFVGTENTNCELPEQASSPLPRILFLYIYTPYTKTITTSKTFRFDVICPVSPAIALLTFR